MTIDDKIRDKKLQYIINKEAAKISAVYISLHILLQEKLQNKQLKMQLKEKIEIRRLKIESKNKS